MAHQAALETGGNLPDAEEAEDMVYAVGVEIVAHLAQTRLPPGKARLLHLVPVVSGEAPVLAVGAEGIRRCTGLHIKVKEFRRHPGVGAGAAHAYGQVALNSHPMAVGIGDGILELNVETVLDPAPESDRRRVGREVILRLLTAELRIFPPLGKIHRPHLVAKAAEYGIGQQPVVVCLYKCLIFRI